VQNQLHLLTGAGEIFDHTAVPTLDARGWLPTHRTGRATRRCCDVEHQLAIAHVQVSQL
jgi:hypothetical protein